MSISETDAGFKISIWIESQESSVKVDREEFLRLCKYILDGNDE